MKKKSLIALLALVVACMLVFAACGDKADTDKGDSNADNTSASTELTTDENGEVFTPNEGTPVLPPSTPDVTEPTAPAGKTDAEKVADYVAAHENEIKSSFEQGFTAGGLTCSTAVKTEGTGIILTININEIDNLTAEQKTVMQTTFDQMAPSLSANLTEIQKEIPELDYIKLDICEKDGDYVATIKVDDENTAAPVTPAPSTPAPSTPEENTPVYSTGSVAYKYTQAGSDDYLAFVFMYDENQNVTEVMYTISGKNLSQEDIDELDEAYDSIEQTKDMGVNLNADLINIDNEHRLEVAILITGELDVAFVEGMLETDFAGTTIPLAEAEAAVIAQGFVKA